MRTTKELLEVTLENFDRHYHSITCPGICLVAQALERDGVIDYLEYGRLCIFLDENLPFRLYGAFNTYSFRIGEKQPRIDWLKQQIEKLEQTK